jgi:protein O-mannosyl-transferase
MQFRKYSKYLIENKTIVFFLFFVLIFLTYHQIIQSPFFWDDELIVVENKVLRNPSGLSDIFGSDIFGEKIQKHKGNFFYRPITTCSYIIDYQLYKLNPTGYNISNILWYFFSVISIYLLVLKLMRSQRLALITGIIFCIHPVFHENVSSVSCRGESIMLLFFSLSFLFFIEKKKNKYFYFLSLFLYIMALLSKENAVVLPLILMAWLLLIRSMRFHKALLQSAPFLSVMILYIVVRIFLYGNTSSINLSMIAEADIHERIYTVPLIIFSYLKILLFPYQYHWEYHFVLREFHTWSMWAFILLISVLLFSYLLKGKRYPFFYFFIFWFFAGLAPVLNIYPPLTASLREHWVNISAIAFFPLLLSGFFRLYEMCRRSQLLRISILSLFVFYLLYCFAYNQYRTGMYKNPEQLYLHDLQYAPESFILWNNLGVEQFRKQEIEEAGTSFMKSIERSPGKKFDVALNNYGVYLLRKGKPLAAIDFFEKSILSNDYHKASENLKEIIHTLESRNAGAEPEDYYEKLILQKAKKALLLSSHINKE